MAIGLVISAAELAIDGIYTNSSYVVLASSAGAAFVTKSGRLIKYTVASSGGGSMISPDTLTSGTASNGSIDFVVGGVSVGTLTLSGGVGRLDWSGRIESSVYSGDPLTLAQRNALVPIAGWLVYVSDVGVKEYQYYDGTSWIPVGSGGAGAVSSVFGRTGAVVAVAGDYTATQITNSPAGNIAATNVQAAINELDTEKAIDTAVVHKATAETISGVKTFTAQPVGITGASIVNVPAGTIASTNVQAAINELATEMAVDASVVHLAGSETITGAKTFAAQPVGIAGSSITNTPAGGISSTTVQAAINELDNEKVSSILASGRIIVGSGANVATPVVMSGEATISNLGAVTLSTPAVTGKPLTGLVTVGGTVTATDTILSAIGKLQGNLTAIDSVVILQGTWDASTGVFPGSGTAQAGYSWIVSVTGTVNGVTFNAGDRIIAITDNASTGTFAGNWFKADYTDQVSSVFGRTGAVIAAAGDYTGSQVTNVPSGNIAATNVQAAITELDNEKLTNTLASAQIFVGSGTNVATGVPMSGEATIANTGAVTLQNSAVIGKVLTGLNTTVGAAIVASDTIVGAFGKMQGILNGLTAAITLRGTWDASSGVFPGLGAAQPGDAWVVSVAGTTGGVTFAVGDRIISLATNASTSTFAGNWFQSPSDAIASVFGRTGTIVATLGDYSGSLITNVPAGNISSTTVQAAINELDVEKALDSAVVHLTGAETISGAKTFSVQPIGIAGSSIVNTPAGNITATTVQAAINELDLEKAVDANVVHLTGAETISGAKTFSTQPVGIIGASIGNTPAGGISSITVQAAINELDTEKATDSTVVHLAGAESITGVKTFTAQPVGIVAGSIASTPSGTLAATDVQSALVELDTEKAADTTVVHLAGSETISGVKTFSAQPAGIQATSISTAPAGNLSSTNVQASLAELDTEKLDKTLTSAQVFVGNGSNVATGVAISGEATITNAGVVTLGNAAVTGKVLTGLSTVAGTVVATDSILGAIGKLQGTVAGLNSAITLQGTWDASTGSFPGGGTAQPGHTYIVSVGGTVDGVTFDVGDRIIALVSNASTSTFNPNWFKEDYTNQVLSVYGRTGAVVATAGDYTASLITNVPAGGVSSITVQAAINELDVEKATDATVVHLAGAESISGVKNFTAQPTGIIGASIGNTPAGNLASTNVQDAINELDVEKASDALVVHLAGAESITGVKTFTAQPVGIAGSSVVNTPAGNISSVTVQAAINELDTEKADDTLVVHKAGAESITGAKTFTVQPIGIVGSSIGNTPAGGIASTDVQSAINELDLEKADDALVLHKSGAESVTGIKTFTAQPVGIAASSIVNTPAGGIAATDIQSAVNELDTEKAPLASPTFTGIPAAPTAAPGTNTTQLATTAFVQQAATNPTSLDGNTYMQLINGQIQFTVDGNVVGTMTYDTGLGMGKLTWPGGIDPAFYQGSETTLAQRNALVATSPLTKKGYLVYVVDVGIKEWQYWDGSAWRAVGPSVTVAPKFINSYANYAALPATRPDTSALVVGDWATAGGQAGQPKGIYTWDGTAWNASFTLSEGSILGFATTFAGLPSARPDGSDRVNGDYAILTARDGANPPGLYRFNVATWVLTLASVARIDDLSDVNTTSTPPNAGDYLAWNGSDWAPIAPTLYGAASETVSGLVELATAAETVTGTDNTRAVHPAGLGNLLNGLIGVTGQSDLGTYNPILSSIYTNNNSVKGNLIEVGQAALMARIADWATATSYQPGRYFNALNKLYKVLVGHVSSSIAADLLAGNIVEVSATASTKYSHTFVIGDFVAGVLTIPAATHGLGTGMKLVQVYESGVQVGIETSVNAGTGDVTITIPVGLEFGGVAVIS